MTASITPDFAAIRRELSRTSITATTMNFIVWIDDPGFRPWVVERLAKILVKHPARAILLDACGDRPPGATIVRADADGNDPLGNTVLGERVDIGVADLPPAEISSETASLMIGGLPTLLWWTGEGIADEPYFASLVELADSLVVDSSGTRNDRSSVVELATFLSSRPTVALRDLAFMRLRPWQSIIARFFDDPALMEELYTVRSIRIVSGSDAEALYLGGWLASRLGWSATKDHFTDTQGNTIPFAHERAGRIRRVRSIELTTADSTYTASISNDDESVVCVEATGHAAGPKRYEPLPAIDSPSLLERAILEPATDEVFEMALRVVGLLTEEREA